MLVTSFVCPTRGRRATVEETASRSCRRVNGDMTMTLVRLRQTHIER